MIASRELRTILWAMLLCSCSPEFTCKTPGAVRIDGVCSCPEGMTFRSTKSEAGECVASSDEPSGASEPDARVPRADASDKRDAAKSDDGQEAEGPTGGGPTGGGPTGGDSGIVGQEPKEDAASTPEPRVDAATPPDPVVDAGAQPPVKVDAGQPPQEKPDAAVQPPACVPKTEECDGDDDDCDGKIDEGALNACGKCGAVPLDDCDGEDDDCDGVIDNPLTALCLLGQACTAGKCQPLCGNGKKDTGEACDPTAPGGTVFNCSKSCTPQKIFATCNPDGMGGPGDCGSGFACGGFRNDNHPIGGNFCLPISPCPEIGDAEWALYGNVCVLPCSQSSQCPLAVPYCYPHPIGGEPASWCVK